MMVRSHARHPKTLKILPDTICNLRELEVLSVGYSRSLAALPVELGNIESLKELDVQLVKVSKIPDSIGRLSNLVKLRLTENMYLETLPKTIGYLRSLEILDISYCGSLIELPVELGNIQSLKELHAHHLAISELPDSIGCLSKLVKLTLSGNSTLKTLPDTICKLKSLEILNINYCRRLKTLPVELGKIESLKELNAGGLAVLELPDLYNLERLEILDLKQSSGLTEFHGLEGLTSIKLLRLSGRCNLSLTKHLLQIYSRFGHDIQIYIPSTEFPDWIRESPDWIQNNFGSTMSFNLPPKVSSGFLSMILCFKDKRNGSYLPKVKNITSGFMWHTSFGGYVDDIFLMILPKSKFPVKGGDRIELTTRVEIDGIRLLYETETTIIDEYHRTTATVEKISSDSC